MSETDFFLGNQGTVGTPIDPAGPGGGLVDPLTEFAQGPVAPATPIPAIIKWDGVNWVYSPVSGGSGALYNLAILGDLGSLSVPSQELGTEIVAKSKTLTAFAAIRKTAGSSAITLVRLLHNGIDSGISFSWVGGVDPNDSVKTAVGSLAVVVGDRLAIKIDSLETGNPEDIIVSAT